DRIAGAGRIEHGDPGPTVECNRVAETGNAARGRRPDLVVVGAVEDVHTVAGVADRTGARCIGADEIALHPVAGGIGTVLEQVDAVAPVARDDVARTRHRAADGVVAASLNKDAVGVVGHGGSAGSVRADVITLHHVVVGVVAGNLDAVGAIAGNDIAGR